MRPVMPGLRSFPYALSFGSAIAGFAILSADVFSPQRGTLGAGVWALGSGTWAVGAAGTGMLTDPQRVRAMWPAAYATAAIYAVPAAVLAAIWAGRPMFPPAIVLNMVLLLIPALSGFWLGSAVATAGRARIGDESRGVGVPFRVHPIWVVVGLLQACVAATLPLAAFVPSGDVILGVWGRVAWGLWFPIGAGVCSLLPWAWALRSRHKPSGLDIYPRRGPSRLVIVVPCCIAWFFLLAYSVALLTHRG